MACDGSANPWWQDFFDVTYADLELREDRERTQAGVDFLVDRLRLAPGQRVLDQCCGVGRLSLPLARRGIEVVGVEQAAAYVERARALADAEGLPCTFHAADALEFVAREPCDAAFNWFTSFGYADDDAVNARMLACAFASLRPGGRFVVEFQNLPRIFAEFQSGHVVRREGPDGKEWLIAAENEADFKRGMMVGRWTIIHPDGRRDERRNATRLLMPHELVRMLEGCGFEVLDLLGSAEGEPFGRRSPRLIALATRPA